MIVTPGLYQGVVSAPSSKSDSQRAILCAGLANGMTTLIGVGKSEDELAMIENIRAIGAAVSFSDNEVLISGITTFPKMLSLNVHESGLGARLMAAVLMINDGNYSLNGTGSLLSRSFSFFKENFEGKIPSITDNSGRLPLTIHGGFEGGVLSVSGKMSSQYISGLILALPLAKNNSELFVNDLNSAPYVQMTLETIRAFGIDIEQEGLKHFIIRGRQKYLPTNYKIERDWSSAAFWLVASALGQKISVEGLNLASFQADKEILKVFKAANCSVEIRENRIFINGKDRKAFVYDCSDCPDLFPAFAAFAALTCGKSTIFGLNRLEDKESNRGKTLKIEFQKLGILIELDEKQNAMYINGNTSIHGGRVFSNNDHRIAMSLAILGLFADNPVEIENPDSVKKSYPSFWEDLENLKK